MHVDVNFFERYFDEQQRRRIDAVRQDRAIAFGQCPANQTIAHKAAIDEKKLRIARRAPLARSGNKTAHPGNRRERNARVAFG